MDTTSHSSRGRRLRWAARLVLFVPLVLAWFMAIGNAIDDPSGDLEGIGLVVGLLVITLAGVVAWFRERLGGMILIGLAAAVFVFAYLTSNPNSVAAGAIFMLPGLISGVLFVVADRLDPRMPQRTKRQPRTSAPSSAAKL